MQITPHEIHIWSADLTVSLTEKNKKMAWLSMSERQRALRFNFPMDRNRYIIAHSKLREILSLYLKILPQDIVFDYEENKKPFLLTSNTMSLQFNLSHSTRWAVFAFTIKHAIGVDIEKIQKKYNEGIVKRFFSSEENNNFLQLSREEQKTAFYRIWSRKEAIIKATGKGFTTPLSSFSVSVYDVPEVLTISNEKWTLLPLSIHADYQSAVATNQPVQKILYWSIFDHGYLLNKVSSITIDCSK